MIFWMMGSHHREHPRSGLPGRDKGGFGEENGYQQAAFRLASRRKPTCVMVGHQHRTVGTVGGWRFSAHLDDQFGWLSLD